MFLSLKQRRDDNIDPEDTLMLSGSIPDNGASFGGGIQGDVSDSPLSPVLNATTGVDIIGPADSAPLRPSPSMMQDPTSVQSVDSAVNAHPSGSGYNPQGAPALTPGPAAPKNSKPTTSAGIVDPFAGTTKAAKRQPTPAKKKGTTGASFTMNKPVHK